MSAPPINLQPLPSRVDGYNPVPTASQYDNIPMQTIASSNQPGMGYPPAQNIILGLQSQSTEYKQQVMYPPEQPGYGREYPPGLITNQPGEWMNTPQNIPHVMGGLAYLASIDQLLIHQKVELFEVLTGFETKNKYTIKNTLGQKVYWAVEDSSFITRNCCGPNRPFDMKILDAYKNEIIHLKRPLACSCCCCPCCLQLMKVYSPPNNLVGTIEQNWSICYPNFSLKNATGEVVLKIKGPCSTSSCCKDVQFKIKSLDGTQVGKISKQWTGLLREMYTDADHFGIAFPLDLDVNMKAVCVGAVFLIDMMFFEHSG